MKVGKVGGGKVGMCRGEGRVSSSLVYVRCR